MWDEILPLISWVKNYSLILAQILGVIYNLMCEVTMTMFCTSQCHKSVKVLNVMNEDVMVLKDALANLNTQKSTFRKLKA